MKHVGCIRYQLISWSVSK